MSTCIIELNDAGITVTKNGQVLIESPGVAVAMNDRVLTGSEACEYARLAPAHCYDRFWNELDQDPLPNATSRIRTNADLAFLHLQHIWDQIDAGNDAVVVAAPGTIEPQQLGLFLGIARECEIHVAGIVDSAVCAADTPAPGHVLMHLDIQLHRTVLTLLDQGATLSRADVDVVLYSGLADIHEAWVSAVADTFVRSTRFDPMHIAETEQTLFDRLPGWIKEFENTLELNIELTHQDRSYEVTVHRQKLLQATAAIYERIVEHIRGRLDEHLPTVLLISQRIAGLPGLADILAQLPDVKVHVRDSVAVAQNATTKLDAIKTPEDSLQFVTGLPWMDKETVAEISTTARRIIRPTHLIYDGRAIPLSGATFVVGSEIDDRRPGLQIDSNRPGVSRKHFDLQITEHEVHLEDHSTYGTILNGHRIDGRTQVKIGDRIRLGSPAIELLLVSVEEPHG